LTTAAKGLLTILLVLALAVVALVFASSRGWLSFIGVHSETKTSQVIQAVRRTQEISLLSLGIQGITSQEQCSHVFGKCIPGSTEKAFLQYDFNAKLGIDGQQVEITKTGEHAYRISVPEFISIGFSEPDFQVAVEDGGALRWVTPDIDQVEMINEILDDAAKQAYIQQNEDALQDQTKVFYDTLITSIDPDVKTTYEFR
jgi:hypothetical protein